MIKLSIVVSNCQGDLLTKRKYINTNEKKCNEIEKTKNREII